MNKISFKNPSFIIRLGLALVFLANGLGAFYAREDLGGLIGGSFVPHLLPFSITALTFFVGVHDIIIFFLILFLHKHQKYLFGWIMIWLIIVMAVVGEPLDIMEHLGFFAMAVALWMDSKHQSDYL